MNDAEQKAFERGFAAGFAAAMAQRVSKTGTQFEPAPYWMHPNFTLPKVT